MCPHQVSFAYVYTKSGCCLVIGRQFSAEWGFYLWSVLLIHSKGHCYAVLQKYDDLNELLFLIMTDLLMFLFEVVHIPTKIFILDIFHILDEIWSVYRISEFSEKFNLTFLLDNCYVHAKNPVSFKHKKNKSRMNRNEI